MLDGGGFADDGATSRLRHRYRPRVL